MNLLFRVKASFSHQGYDFESCISEIEEKLLILEYKIGHKVKSEVAPNLKTTLWYTNYVPSFMLLSQSAQTKCLRALRFTLLRLPMSVAIVILFAALSFLHACNHFSKFLFLTFNYFTFLQFVFDFPCCDMYEKHSLFSSYYRSLNF